MLSIKIVREKEAKITQFQEIKPRKPEDDNYLSVVCLGYLVLTVMYKWDIV